MPSYKAVFHNLPLPAIVFSSRGAVLESNASAQRAFSTQCRQSSVAETVGPWLGDAVTDFIEDGSQCATLERTLKCNGRRPRVFSISLSKVEHSDTQPHAVAVLTDITERSRNQEQIRRQAAIIDSSNDAMISLSLGGRILSANKSAAELYGYATEELVGKPVFRLVPPGLEGEMREVLRRIREGSRVVRLETLRCRRNGPIFPVSDTYSAIVADGAAHAVSLVSRNITKRKESELALRNSHENLERTLDETVSALSMTLEKRDLYTAGHQHKVALLACAIGRQMGLCPGELDAVHTAGVLHDIGKICIPMAILSKPARLSRGEMSLVRCHPQNGLDIIKNIPFPYPVGAIIHQHHERMDGTGYPEGLIGDDITLGARIIAVADVLEAMSAHRPYRPALGIEAATDEFKKHRGTLYDPDTCDTLLQLVDQGCITMQNGELILCQ